MAVSQVGFAERIPVRLRRIARLYGSECANSLRNGSFTQRLQLNATSRLLEELCLRHCRVCWPDISRLLRSEPV